METIWTSGRAILASRGRPADIEHKLRRVVAKKSSPQNQQYIGLDKSLDNSCLGTYITGMSVIAAATRKEIYDVKSYDPKRSIGGLLGRVKIEMVAALDAELAPLDITAAQFVILKSIN